MFSPSSSVNDRVFLGVDPGHLYCSLVNISKGCPMVSGNPDELAKASRSHRFWIIMFLMVEQGGWGWNEIIQPAGKGRGERKRLNFCDPFNMNAFFGADTFPLTT